MKDILVTLSVTAVVVGIIYCGIAIFDERTQHIIGDSMVVNPTVIY